MNNSPIKIGVICPSRPNSKFLAHFIHGYLAKTKDKINTKLWVMPSEKDQWNREFISYIEQNHPDEIKFVWENYGLAQRGHDRYLNELSALAIEEGCHWVSAICEDMYHIQQDWDKYLRNFIIERQLDWKKIYCIIPGFTTPGACEHILSFGWLDAVKTWGKYCNADSYINTVIDQLGDEIKAERRIDFTLPMFIDYTRDLRFMNLLNTELPGEPQTEEILPVKWGDPQILQDIAEDARKLKRAIIEQEK